MYASAAATYCSREEEQRYVDRHPAEDSISSIAGTPSRVPGILMKRFGPRPARVAVPSPPPRPRRVVGERRRQLERHPAVDAVREIMRRTEQIGRLAEVSSASSKNSSSPALPRPSARIAAS